MNLIQHSLKTLALGLIVTSLPLAARSQPAGRPGAMHGGAMRGMERISKELGLTPQQQARIQKVVDSSMAQNRAIQANTTLKPEQKRAKFMQNMKSMQSSLNAILTPAQRQKVATMRQQRMKAMQGARPAPKAGR